MFNSFRKNSNSSKKLIRDSKLNRKAIHWQKMNSMRCTRSNKQRKRKNKETSNNKRETCIRKIKKRKKTSRNGKGRGSQLTISKFTMSSSKRDTRELSTSIRILKAPINLLKSHSLKTPSALNLTSLKIKEGMLNVTPTTKDLITRCALNTIPKS